MPDPTPHQSRLALVALLPLMVPLLVPTGCGGDPPPGETDSMGECLCDDSDPCTTSTCDPVSGECIDEPTCADDNPCTVDTCEPDTGECTFTPLCDDGVGCTTDTCMPDGTCVHTPNNAVCDLPATCVTGVCSPSAPAGGPGLSVVAIPGISGCWQIRDDAFCADTWDGCACNGVETCTGTSANPQGCAEAGPPDLALPCEVAVGDNDECTVENCCEDWDPGGCRVHAEAEAQWAAIGGEDEPPLQRFCESLNANDVVVAPTPWGDAQCVVGDSQYVVPAQLPPPGDLLGTVDQPYGYFCNPCNPCETFTCTPNGGTGNPCGTVDLAEGAQVFAPDPTPDEALLAFLEPGCVASTLSCEGDENFGCAQQGCSVGMCSLFQNGDNPDPTMSEECHGFPTREYDPESIPPFELGSAAQGCFELQCVNTGGAVFLPNFECHAVPHDELCENGLFCDGPAECDLTQLAPSGDPEQAGTLLALTATSLSDAAPAPGSLIAGCTELSPQSVCADGIDCTVDMCDEGSDTCTSAEDERFCSLAGGGDWSPCDPGSACVGDVCMSVDNPCVSEFGCALECVDAGEFRQCVADDSCVEQECFSEAYTTIDLGQLTDLCPFVADDPPQGDRDFDSHGPAVRVDVSIAINPADNHEILATVHFSAQETESDFSTLNFEWPPFVVATSLFELQRLTSATTGNAIGVSAPGGDAGVACGGCGIVDFSVSGIVVDAEARGDTPDDDISDDDNCNEDTLLELLDLGTVEAFVRDPACGPF
ncbi:MAG: hypothetical protein AAF721_10115 [Myxococcota bacterium]